MKYIIISFTPIFLIKIYLNLKFYINRKKINFKKKKLKYKNFFFKNCNIFFGYHDKINLKGKKLLAHLHDKYNNFYVGYFENNKFIKIFKTELCSWQLGSQLQWINQNNFIFNTISNNFPISILYNIKKHKIIKKFNYLVYNVDRKFKKFISLDFNDLYLFRKGYGYNLNKFQNNLNGSIKIVDINNNKVLYEIKKNLVAKKLKFENENKLYFNHATFSPCGKKILFFAIDNSQYRVGGIFLMLFDLKKKSLKLIKNLSNISHYCWIDNWSFLYTSQNLNQKYDYNIYDLKFNKTISTGLSLSQDGHPMMHPKNKNLILTDTYPDETGFQNLIVYDIKRKKKIWATSLNFSTDFLMHKRCDLHPKWDDSGSKIVIDYAKDKKRIIRVYNFLN